MLYGQDLFDVPDIKLKSTRGDSKYATLSGSLKITGCRFLFAITGFTGEQHYLSKRRTDYE